MFLPSQVKKLFCCYLLLVRIAFVAFCSPRVIPAHSLYSRLVLLLFGVAHVRVGYISGNLADAAYHLRRTRFAESLLNDAVTFERRSVESVTARSFSPQPSC